MIKGQKSFVGLTAAIANGPAKEVKDSIFQNQTTLFIPCSAVGLVIKHKVSFEMAGRAEARPTSRSHVWDVRSMLSNIQERLDVHVAVAITSVVRNRHDKLAAG
jgi:hypothetical protein